jgi:tyrosyl-tRNA synthetase
MQIDTDINKIDEILNRGTIVEILPTKDEFRNKLLSGEKLRLYIGFDATAPNLHLSHAKNFMFMEKLRKLGHEVIILFGDFTARIGDPTGENTTRKQLSREDVLENVKKWIEMVKPFMDFNNKENPPIIKYNHDWLSKLSFEDIINIASNFTVQHMISRDMFQKRLKEEKPIHLHEFLYPLMQGYDSVAMDVDAEVCGTDQTFNALAGRMLLKKMKGKEKFVVALTLMENPKTKELMSKSKGTGVFLDGKAVDMFGQIMSQPDEMMEILFVNNTLLSLDEIKEILNQNDPKKSKLSLAFEITKIYHGKDLAIDAQKNWEATFSNKEIPEHVEHTFGLDETKSLMDIAIESGLVSSKTDYRRLLDTNSIEHMDTETIIKDDKQPSQIGTYRIGKKRFFRIK